MHVALLGSPEYPAPTIADLERKTREKYPGRSRLAPI
jgi:hypothetical protein